MGAFFLFWMSSAYPADTYTERLALVAHKKFDQELDDTSVKMVAVYCDQQVKQCSRVQKGNLSSTLVLADRLLTCWADVDAYQVRGAKQESKICLIPS